MDRMTHDVVEGILMALEAEIVQRGIKLDEIKAYTTDKYAREIDAAAKQYWKDGSKGGFLTRMRGTVKFGLTDAFDLGASDMGITKEDYTEKDTKARDDIITEEQSHIPDLFEFLDKAANSGTQNLADLQYRLDLWKARFDDVRGRARVIVAEDAKLEWVYGDTEHCPSCLKLNGIVKRASFWKKYGVEPKNPPNEKLKCKGFKCQCELQPTDKPLKRGGLPRLP